MLGRIWNYFSPSTPEQQKYDIPRPLQGQLFIKEINKPFQILAEECTISLSIKDEKTFNYVLNITNEDNNNWKTLSFALNVDSSFCKFINSSGTQCLMWLKGETFYILELFSDESIVKNEPIFCDFLCTLITSNDFQIPISEAKTEKTRKDYVPDFDVIENLDEFLQENFKNIKQKKIENQINDDMKNLSIDKINKKDFKSKFNIYKEICKYAGISKKYKNENETYVQISDENSYFVIVDIGDFSYLIVLENKECILVDTILSKNNSIMIDENLFNICFMIKQDKTYFAYRFDLKEKNSNDIKNINNLISKCLYESTTRKKYEALPKDSIQFIDEEGIYENDFIQNQGRRSQIQFNNFYEVEGFKPEIKNRGITQAFKYDKAFLIKDNNSIDVLNFENNGNDKNTFTPFKQEGNALISGGIMFNGDNEILFKDKINKDSLWQYDLNKQEIVQEWKCGDTGAELLDFTHSEKFGQISQNCDILGINKNKIFLMDGRVNRKNKIVDDKTYGPSSSKNFLCISTPQFKSFATGSSDGDIRLYQDISKNAKTLIPCFGDPIRSIDITKNGDYLLATCDKYLMLINTLGEKGENGFTTTLKRAKKKPITLKISPEDVVSKGLGEECYTPAKFDINKSNRETIITTSLGQYIIVWNFEDAKNDVKNAYQIKNVNEYVIGNTTKFNKHQLIVTMPNKVRLQDEQIVEI